MRDKNENFVKMGLSVMSDGMARAVTCGKKAQDSLSPILYDSQYIIGQSYEYHPDFQPGINPTLHKDQLSKLI